MYVLSWQTVYVLTQALFWYLFPLLLCNSANKQQITLSWGQQFATRIHTLFRISTLRIPKLVISFIMYIWKQGPWQTSWDMDAEIWILDRDGHFLLRIQGCPHHLNFQGPQAKFEGSLHWNTLPILHFLRGGGGDGGVGGGWGWCVWCGVVGWGWWGCPLAPHAKFHKGPIGFSEARGLYLWAPGSPVMPYDCID